MCNKHWGIIIFISLFLLGACSTETGKNITHEKGNDTVVERPAEDKDGYVLSSDIDNINDHLDYTDQKLKTIYFAGGCFWGVEAYMKHMYGVVETSAGYANGEGDSPSYADVIKGDKGFVETVAVTYDPKRVSLDELVDRLFLVIDPTSKNRQGPDVGVQYRTGIYYTNKQDADTIQKAVEQEQQYYKEKIVTEVEPLDAYYLAEDMHQDYLENNPNGYCHINLNVLDDFTIDPIPEDEALIESLSVEQK